MAATITATGTFSTITTAERPTNQGGTINETFDYDSLIYEEALVTNKGGFPELEQFIGLVGQAYGLTGRAAAVRLSTMLTIWLNRASRVAPERAYNP